jgi:hypothetical protein
MILMGKMPLRTEQVMLMVRMTTMRILVQTMVKAELELPGLQGDSAAQEHCTLLRTKKRRKVSVVAALVRW